MTEKLSNEVYWGRPYGGVDFLWLKDYSARINIGVKAVSGRYLSVGEHIACRRSAASSECEHVANHASGIRWWNFAITTQW